MIAHRGPHVPAGPGTFRFWLIRVPFDFVTAGLPSGYLFGRCAWWFLHGGEDEYDE
ncbi:MAG: hypothetical protein ACR2KM_07105 [Gemmatimonadaceae bacterium]